MTHRPTMLDHPLAQPAPGLFRDPFWLAVFTFGTAIGLIVAYWLEIAGHAGAAA